MNPITQRHRMWARASSPDRQAQRPAHHRRQRQTPHAHGVGGRRDPWHDGHHRDLARQFVASVGGARPIRMRRGRPAPESSMAQEGPVTSASTWQPTRKRSPGR